MPTEDKVNQLENRVKRLEEINIDNSRRYENICNLLSSIEGRLIGSIGSETPGLISQVNDLKAISANNSTRLIGLTQDLETFRHMYSSIKPLEDEIKLLKTAIDDLQKMKWIVRGITIACIFILAYFGKVNEFFKKILN